MQHAVNLSSGGHPQLQLTLAAVEQYDFETQQWADWSQYDQGITGYLILAGKEGKATKNAEQVMKVFKWDGMSFTGLDAMPITGSKVQFRVADNVYEGKTNQKVVWIDDYDAKPSSGLGAVEKLDANKLAALDKQFAGTLKGLTGGKIAVAKAPATPPAPPAPKKAAAPAVSAEDAADVQTRDPDCIPNPVAAPAPGIVRPPAPPAPPKTKAGRPPKAKAEAPAPAAKVHTINTAWEEVVAQTEGVDDTARGEAWNSVMDQVAPGKADKDFTQEEWAAQIKYTVAECKSH
jgi:hypothetical protein